MRVSGWLLLFQQTFCAGMILWATALRMRTRPSALHLALASLGCGIACTSSLILSGGTARFACAVAVMILSMRMLHALPAALALRGLLSALALTVILTGLIGAAAPGGAMPLLPLLSLCLPMLPLLDKRIPAPRTGMLSLTLQGTTLRLRALIDSGNLLHDPLTALPVIVCSSGAVTPLLPFAEDDAMRVIHAQTASGRMTMPIFRADAVVLTLGGKQISLRAMIAAAPEGFGHFDALVPASLAENPPATTQGGCVPW